MRKKLLIGVYNPSIILTYISVFCSVFGMGYLLFAEQAKVNDKMMWPMILLVIAGVCDTFDGRVARMCKRTDKEKEFGVQLDSLADTVSFVIFPAIMLLYLTQLHPLSVIAAMFYAFAGIMRLCWFNVTVEENKGMFFGLPVTTAAVIFPMFYLAIKRLVLYAQVYIYPILFIAVALAFIGNFKIKKPGLKTALTMIGIAIILIVLLFIF